MLLRRIADAREFNCEDDRGRLGVKNQIVWEKLFLLMLITLYCQRKLLRRIYQSKRQSREQIFHITTY